MRCAHEIRAPAPAPVHIPVQVLTPVLDDRLHERLPAAGTRHRAESPPDTRSPSWIIDRLDSESDPKMNPQDQGPERGLSAFRTTSTLGARHWHPPCDHAHWQEKALRRCCPADLTDSSTMPTPCIPAPCGDMLALHCSGDGLRGPCKQRSAVQMLNRLIPSHTHSSYSSGSG